MELDNSILLNVFETKINRSQEGIDQSGPWNRFPPSDFRTQNRKNYVNFDLCDLFLGLQLFGPSSHDVFGLTMVASVFDFKNRVMTNQNALVSYNIANPGQPTLPPNTCKYYTCLTSEFSSWGGGCGVASNENPRLPLQPLSTPLPAFF